MTKMTRANLNQRIEELKNQAAQKLSKTAIDMLSYAGKSEEAYKSDLAAKIALLESVTDEDIKRANDMPDYLKM